jgi:hypothetical protein
VAPPAVQRVAVWMGPMAWMGPPHVDGASSGVVEGRPGGAAPTLAGSRCGGAAGAATAASATAATPATVAVATTTATAASAGGGESKVEDR